MGTELRKVQSRFYIPRRFIPDQTADKSEQRVCLNKTINFTKTSDTGLLSDVQKHSNSIFNIFCPIRKAPESKLQLKNLNDYQGEAFFDSVRIIETAIFFSSSKFPTLDI